MFRFQYFKIALALLTLALCASSLQATTLVASPTSLSLSCDTVAGPTAASVGITLFATGSALNVTVTSSSSAVTLPNPATKSVSSTSTATSFSFTMAAACAGATNGQQVTLTFTPATGTALLVTATLTVTSPTTLVANPTALTLNCDTVLGPTPASVGITLASTGSPLTVTVTANPSSVITLPSPAFQSVSSTSNAVSYSFTLGAGCKGATNGATVNLIFTPGTGSPLTVVATLAITNSASALAPSPSAVNITCTKTGTNYSRGAAQTVNVTSPAPGGTPFTVDNTVNALPNWLSVTPLGGGTAGSTAIPLTVQATTTCGGSAVGTYSFVVHLLNAPAPDKLLTVTIQVGAAAVLAASPTSVALSYIKGSLTYNGVFSSVSATPALFFTLNQSTLPVWLNATPISGTTTSAVPITFIPTSGAETLTPGMYSANVHLQVSGDLDTVIPVTLQVKDSTPTLSVAEGTTRTIPWTIATGLPSLTITPVSSDSPISYAVTTTAGTLYPQVSATSGLAYNFGNAITVTFLQSVFSAAAPGTALTGSVILTPVSGGAVTVNITVNVRAAGANITNISPAALPTGAGGPYTVAISGSGFVPSGGLSVQTNVGIVAGGIIVPDGNISVAIQNATTIVLTITPPVIPDPLLPFTGSGGPVYIGVCNPQGTGCTAPTSTTTLQIGVNPIVQTVTSASSYIQANAPALNSIAPYDIVSIFGTNFCVSGGTGCMGQSAVLYGATDTVNPATERYLASLSPDSPGATQRVLAVTFQTHGTSPTFIANAPLLFATNNQINLVVPDLTKNYIGNTVDIVVSFGYGAGANMLKSAPFSVTIAATDPGVFTIGGDGQGDAAALAPNYSLISSGSPANSMSTGTDSDVIAIYVTGLGKPDSTDSGSGYSATCMTPDAYWASVNSLVSPTVALSSDDGLVIQSAYIPNAETEPCVLFNSPNVPSVSIGGIASTASTIKYAGWVTGSIAGLYQINVQLPASTSNFVDASGTSGALTGTARYLPVVVTASGKSSQPTGVAIWAVQSLKVVASGATSGASGSVWAGTTITATDGAPSYTYAVTSAQQLPAGLTLTGAAIAGTPTTPGTYVVTFTATDSNSLTGTVTVTFVIS